jgi:hypothetical protein
VIHDVMVPLDRGWKDAAQWLTERIGEKYTKSSPMSVYIPSLKPVGYKTTRQDIEDSLFQWDCCFEPATFEYRFMIKDAATAMLFKLTWGGR